LKKAPFKELNRDIFKQGFGSKLEPWLSHFKSLFIPFKIQSLTMKIFFITHTYSLGGSGGGEQFVSNFLQEALRKGHELMVFTPGGKQFSEQEKKLGLRVYHCPVFGHHAFHKFEYALLWWKAVLLARKFRPDVIHAQNDVFPGLIGWFVKKFTGKPLVLAVEYLSDQAVSINLKLVFALNKFLLPKLGFDAIVSWSSFVVEKFFLPWGIPRKKITIVPGAVNTKAFASKASPHPKLASRGKNWIVSAKPLHKTNAMGISYIIKAMAIVSKKHPEWKYGIIGQGQSKPMLEALVEKLGLQNKIFFFGQMPNSEMPKVYAAADIIAHSFAFKATTSIALMETMAAGKAIVATESGEVKSTVADTALLARQKDSKSIAVQINRLIENPGLRKRLGAAARARAQKNYSIEAVVSVFEEIYRKLLKKHGIRI